MRRSRRTTGCLVVVGVAVLWFIVAVIFGGSQDAGTQAVPTYTPTTFVERSAPVDIPLDAPAELPTATPEPPPTATPLPLPTDTPVPPPPTNTPVPVVFEPPTPFPLPPSDCDCSADVYNCGDFGWTYIEGDSAQACYARCMAATGADVHGLDGDNDGSACEFGR